MRSLFNSGIMENVSIYTDIDRLQRLKIVLIFITNLACCHSNFNSIPVSFSGMPVFLSVMMIWLNTRRTKQAQVSTLIPVAAPKKPFAFCPTLFYLPLRGGITTTSQAWGQKNGKIRSYLHYFYSGIGGLVATCSLSHKSWVSSWVSRATSFWIWDWVRNWVSDCIQLILIAKIRWRKR